MNEVDDRLAGDPVWELFPYPVGTPGPQTLIASNYTLWLAVASLIAVACLLSPALSVVLASVAVAVPDFRTGRQLARSIPNKAGGTICARFAYAWGAWKLGLAAFGLTFVVIVVFAIPAGPEPPSAFKASVILCTGGLTAAAVLTASGFLAAYRSGMRVWLGEGVNQARTLLMVMLIGGFTVGEIVPMIIWLGGRFSRTNENGGLFVPELLVLFGSIIGGALVILLLFDWLNQRVVADRPGKFGPKVPTVGKWNYEQETPLP
jgi:hypothetical protein